jgi:hypothetical protein
VKKPYTGTKDGASKGKRPGTERFMVLLCEHFKMKNLGTWNVRVMRSAPANIQKLPVTDPKVAPYLSVHATGRAGDAGKQNAAKLHEIADWLVNTPSINAILEEVHDYSFKGAKQTKAWGRGWRTSRNAWKVYDEKENAGTPGGLWLHFELTPKAADSVAVVNEAWGKAVGA